jgi:hypothetical protein
MKNVITTLSLIAFVGYGPSVLAQSTPTAAVEKAFVAAADLEVINRISDVPPDVVQIFRSVVPWESMANWGEAWNETDVLDPGEPISQHVFSGVSKDVAVVVFQSGGIVGRNTNVVVARRGVPGFCHYRLGNALPREMRAIQEAVRNPKAHWNGVTMQCEYRG